MEPNLGDSTLGNFSFGVDEVVGDLRLTRQNPKLRLWCRSLEKATPIAQTITGTLTDFKSVSLFDCLEQSAQYYYSPDKKEATSIREVLFEYAVIGDRRIGSSEKVIDAIEFHLSGATELFDQYSSFHDIFTISSDEVKELLYKHDCKVKEILRDNLISDRDCEQDSSFYVGEHPIVSVFTDPDYIIELQTPVGLFKVKNAPVRESASSSGYKLENEIRFTLEFDCLLSIKDAVERIDPITFLFSIFSDHDFEVFNIRGYCKGVEPYDEGFLIYRYLGRTELTSERPHRTRRLIKPESNVAEFNKVLIKWLNSFEEWRQPREQFFGTYFSEYYSTDRLVKCANTFDIIPSSAFGERPELDKALEEAKKQAKSMFKCLPDSLERQSILGALGRIGTHTLKNKIRSRVDIINTNLSVDLPDMYLVTDHAVDCRNYYVHGGNKKLDYQENFEIVMFFIDSLEFIYVVSELIELGWDYENAFRDSGSAHRINEYIRYYPKGLRILESLIASHR